MDATSGSIRKAATQSREGDEQTNPRPARDAPPPLAGYAHVGYRDDRPQLEFAAPSARTCISMGAASGEGTPGRRRGRRWRRRQRPRSSCGSGRPDTRARAPAREFRTAPTAGSPLAERRSWPRRGGATRPRTARAADRVAAQGRATTLPLPDFGPGRPPVGPAAAPAPSGGSVSCSSRAVIWSSCGCRDAERCVSALASPSAFVLGAPPAATKPRTASTCS